MVPLLWNCYCYCSTIIASQALISGSFTLISESMRLNLWPKLKIKYPTETKGQLYIPATNFLLFAGCVGIVLYFRKAQIWKLLMAWLSHFV
jgi:KUP system potassium uptake protein